MFECLKLMVNCFDDYYGLFGKVYFVGSKNNTQHNPAVNNDNQFECRRHSLTGQNASNIDNSNANKDETHPPTSISNLDHNPGKPKSFSSTVLKLFDGHCETIDSQQNESSSVPNQIELN